MFREFHANGRFVRSLNTTFLVLVPKKVGVEDLKDYSSISLSDVVEENFWKRLALWKRHYISQRGRLALIRNTLSCMPTYFMSLFRIPKTVNMRLDRIQREFLWGGGALDRKTHHVKWEVVCSSMEIGGLGIRKLSSFDKALLGK